MLNTAYKKFRKSKEKKILAKKIHLKSISGNNSITEPETDKKETIRSAVSKIASSL